MLRNLVNYINNKEYLIAIYEKKIYIYNYENIIDITENSIKIKLNNKKIFIKGNCMFVKKLENNEILIEGDIKGLEFYE